MKPDRLLFMGIFLSTLLSCHGESASVDPFDECQYTPSATTFRVWSPTAGEMELCLYEDGVCSRIPMKNRPGDCWEAEVRRDIRGAQYTFRSKTQGRWNAESPGIFAKAVSINGDRGVVVDLRESDPDGWESDVSPAVDVPVIYELHHRDFSISPTSGISHRGKYLALTEAGTVSPDSLSTGIDHLKELGITYVQILPSFDFASLDETRSGSQGSYNWGYDPKNYNVPEGSYSMDPADPLSRIREFKQMVAALHRAGIRVVMDVVYNHTFDMAGCALGRVTPGYFYRKNPDGTFADGSACGNETASEQEMMRRFMIASLSYWVEEYHVDGFRFDLMGIHDIETMNAIRAALPEEILLYGEGWSARPPALEHSLLAMKDQMSRMKGIGAFSDDIRNALVGSPFEAEGGFVEAVPGCEDVLRFGLAGGVEHSEVSGVKAWAANPFQHISYVTCHDNRCLRDRLVQACPEATEDQLLRMDKLAQTAVLTSQGIPFLFAGEEVFRTKGGDENSYRSPDNVNAIDWRNKLIYRDLFEYYRDLVTIRKAHPGFRLGSAEAVRSHVHFPETPEGVVIYRIDDLEGLDPARSLTVVLNGNVTRFPVTFPASSYKVLVQDGAADPEGLITWSGGTVSVEPLSALILAEM